MGRYACKICDTKNVRPEVDRLLSEKMSFVGISETMRGRGFPWSPQLVSTHAKHSPQSQIPVGVTRTKDLAVLVRDMTVQAIENEDIKITDPMWKNVTPGLRAQDLLDKRANKADDRKTAIAFALITAGGRAGEGGFLAPMALRQLEDGNTIEGEFEEVDNDPGG